MISRVSSLNNMLGEELMIGSSEGKSNTHQEGFHMSPDMDSMVNKVESDKQGQGGFQRLLHNLWWCSRAWARQPLPIPGDSPDSKFLMWIDHSYSAHLERKHFQL